MKHHPHTLPLFTAEGATVTIPRYGIRLVRESQIIYTKGITGAEMVVDLCRTIGLQERASEELHVFYLNTKNDVIGMELVSKGTLNASLVPTPAKSTKAPSSPTQTPSWSSTTTHPAIPNPAAQTKK